MLKEWVRENESAVHPFPLIAEQRKRMNTDDDSEATFNSNVRDSSVFLFSPRPLSPSSRKLCANGTKLTLGADYVACKIKRLQLYCVIFNCCRLFKIAKTADFLLRFCAIEGGERRENGAFRGPRRLVSEKHCRSQPMDQTHTHTCTTLVQDTRSHARSVIPRSVQSSEKVKGFSDGGGRRGCRS